MLSMCPLLFPPRSLGCGFTPQSLDRLSQLLQGVRPMTAKPPQGGTMLLIDPTGCINLVDSEGGTTVDKKISPFRLTPGGGRILRMKCPVIQQGEEAAVQSEDYPKAPAETTKVLIPQVKRRCRRRGFGVSTGARAASPTAVDAEGIVVRG
jgi:hypothetical protein